MEQYFKVVVTLVLLAIGCQAQHNLTTGQLHSRVRELEENLASLAKLVDMQKSQAVPANNVVSGFEKKGSVRIGNGFTLGTSNTGEVGFHVSLTDDVPLDWGMKLPFDTIVENIGEAYNKAAAEFTCPISGTYLFSLNIACKKDSYVEISVEISNGSYSPRYILNTVCDHRKRALLGGGSLYCGNTQNGGTAIVSLAQGEKVTVKRLWPRNGSGTVILGGGFSTFSGYLLRTP
ncbi:uncharacterized protein LOC123531736 [Mercenaria mercenaria]|uniref:uncharacterized protein LOC123531736 n=1 Tax=Mercenaria mercenaria TaxID=6596 RepID=UPI00234F9BCB|nr:uncharacterized protein LOC123531736 [Mercenaria mercenaria]XP_045168891.2 uncharacterized protein LOC123531736 [Mercenaria mercenaria]XP_045168892.2 uncharacterized protein LOC123531736 [Mercenaria mercenaria]XP_045168894.2 uncharacterized protein LOC123531736 [Mercenaria mercenaria]XP_045168895.2 uncharacterized protein LOC123531736 [Mercenaria mercenaria]